MILGRIGDVTVESHWWPSRRGLLKDQLIRDPPNRINSVEEACVEEASFGDVTVCLLVVVGRPRSKRGLNRRYYSWIALY